MKIERSKNAARNIVFGILLKLYHIVMPFIIRTVMIYYMGIQYVGLNSLFTSILQVLNLAELGVGSAMVYSMYKPIIEDDKKKICALMKLYKLYYRIIGIVVTVLGLSLLPFLPKLIKSDIPADISIYILYLLNLSATVFSYWLFAYKNSILQAHQRTDVISKINIALDTFKYGTQLVTLIVLKNYYIYVIIILVTQILTNIVTAIISSKMYPDYHPEGELSKQERKKINQRIRDLFTAKFGSVILNSADTIVISAFLGLTILAIYQNYYFIMSSVIGVISVFFSSVIAGVGNSLLSETIEKNYNDLKKFTFIISWILCICCCCFACLYQPFMEIWVGKDYILSYSYVILFVVYFYVCEISLVWATVKDAAGLWHADRFRPLIGASANLVINIILVQYIGLYGIILSTIISYVFISMPWLIKNIFSLLYKRSAKEYLIKLSTYVFVTALAVGICILITHYVKGSLIQKLLINVFVCVLIPNVIQYIFLRKTTEYEGSKLLAIKMLKRGR